MGAGNGRDHLGTVFGNASALGVSSHHETRNVLKEDEGYAPLGAQLDEVRTFLSGFGEEDAVVADYPDRVTEEAAKSGHEALAESLLEFHEPWEKKKKDEDYQLVTKKKVA